jgi:hypothetical protein
MDRLKIYVLNHLGSGDGIFTTYIDVGSCLAFLKRQRQTHHYSILAVKGNKTLHIEKIGPDIIRLLNDFTTAV